MSPRSRSVSLADIAVLDLDYVEDAQCETDMNVVMTGRGRFVELQGTAEGEPFSDDEMAQMVALARKGIAELVAAQKHALELGSTRVVLAQPIPASWANCAALLADTGFDGYRTQGELGIEAAEEPHPTFIENALAKARHASERSGLPALADDSGLCVAALGGEPGVRSARFAGPGATDAAEQRRAAAAARDGR